MESAYAQLMFEAGRYADPETKKAILCSVTWSEPYHSEYSYFHGIRLHEPHTGSLGHTLVYTDPILAIQKYLNVKWRGFRPILDIHAGLTTLMHWNTPDLTPPADTGLPF